MLVDDFDVVDLLARRADRCVEVPDVQAAGIMLAAPNGELRVMASSSETIRVLELFEIQAQEGPCVDAHRTGVPVVNQNLAAAGDRWPRFAAEVLAVAFHAVRALPMRLRGSVIGMGPADIEVAQAFADVATIAILQRRAAIEAQALTEQLTRALNSRVVIEQAKA